MILRSGRVVGGPPPLARAAIPSIVRALKPLPPVAGALNTPPLSVQLTSQPSVAADLHRALSIAQPTARRPAEPALFRRPPLRQILPASPARIPYPTARRPFPTARRRCRSPRKCDNRLSHRLRNFSGPSAPKKSVRSGISGNAGTRSVGSKPKATVVGTTTKAATGNQNDPDPDPDPDLEQDLVSGRNPPPVP